jgi:peptide-N4-(N-acetyl-beta-glucosaminyl)asparagine amidase
MAYCIAFSADGATDVTRRYVRNEAREGLDRTRAPEEVLLWIVDEIRQMRRQNMSEEQKRQLVIEDEREDQELRSYIMQNIALEVARQLPELVLLPLLLLQQLVLLRRLRRKSY